MSDNRENEKCQFILIFMKIEHLQYTSQSKSSFGFLEICLFWFKSIKQQLKFWQCKVSYIAVNLCRKLIPEYYSQTLLKDMLLFKLTIISWINDLYSNLYQIYLDIIYEQSTHKIYLYFLFQFVNFILQYLSNALVT